MQNESGIILLFLGEISVEVFGLSLCRYQAMLNLLNDFAEWSYHVGKAVFSIRLFLVTTKVLNSLYFTPDFIKQL